MSTGLRFHAAPFLRGRRCVSALGLMALLAAGCGAPADSEPPGAPGSLIAAAVEERLAASALEDARATLFKRLVPAGETVSGFTTQVVAPTDAYVVLVDPTPAANWGHDCRWYFVSLEGSVVADYPATSPPVWPEDVDTTLLRGTSAPEPTYAEIRERIDAALQAAPPPTGSLPGLGGLPGQQIVAGGVNSGRKRAILISGGYNAGNNHIRYWGDVAFMYNTLVRTYGFLKSEITVLMADGANPAVDRSDGTNSPTDLDNDGAPDYSKDATRATVLAELQNLVNRVGPSDMVFVFATDHGSLSGSNAILNLWNQTQITDAEFASYMAQLPATAFKSIMMEQCYSGGFINDLSGVQNLAISTAADATHVSWAGDTYPYFNEYSYEYTAAMNWRYSDLYQSSPVAVDADPDNNFAVTAKEAHNWAVAHDQSGDAPQFWAANGALTSNLNNGGIRVASATNTGTTGFGNVRFRVGLGDDGKFYTLIWAQASGLGYRKWYKPTTNAAVLQEWPYVGGASGIGWPASDPTMSDSVYYYDINGDGAYDIFRLIEQPAGIWNVYLTIVNPSTVTKIASATNTDTTGYGKVKMLVGLGSDGKYFTLLWSQGLGGYRKWYKPTTNADVFQPWPYAGGALGVGWPPTYAGIDNSIQQFDINNDGRFDTFQLVETAPKVWDVFLVKND